MSDPYAAWMEFRANFLQANKVATTVSFICTVCIALSSRHLYAKTIISKLPLAACFCWFLASLLFGLKIYSNGAVIGLYFCGPVSWLFDFITRCLILWFTYYRTVAVWPRFPPLKYLTIAIQLLYLASFGYVLYCSAPNGPVAINSPQYNQAASLYSTCDVISMILDILLLARLHIINVSQKAINSKLVKQRFFYFAMICLVAIVGLSLVLIGIFSSGEDPYWQWYTILFSFRILLTDIFSNLMRDSLIEAHVSGGRASAVKHVVSGDGTAGPSGPGKGLRRESAMSPPLASRPIDNPRASHSNTTSG